MFQPFGFRAASSGFLFFAVVLSGSPGFGEPSTPPPIDRPPLVLGVGEQRLLRIEGLNRFSIGGPQVRAVTAPASSRNSGSAPLLIKAVQAGTTDLWIWKTDQSSERRRIRVEKFNPTAGLKPELLQGLSELNEVEVIFAGAQAVIRGEIQSVTEAARIEALERSFPDTLRNDTQIADPLTARAETSLLAWINSSPWKSRLRLERRDRNLWLFGSLASTRDLDGVRRRVRGLFPAIRLDLQTLPDDSPTIHFRVYLLELQKNRYGALGITWPPGQQAAFRVTTDGIQNLLQLDLAIHALEADGSARILSKPELVVRAPGDAELFSGGELPIQSRSQYYSNITWKNFGLTLKLKVTHTTAEKVRLEIFTEVSHLDTALASEGRVPGLQANRMRTQVDARYGAPLLLSGLLQETARRTAKGLPILRDIPVLGSLFGSEDWLNDKSELVAILLPSLTPPRAPLERTISSPSPIPLGPVPPPRDWLDPEEEKELRKSPEFPWNALMDGRGEKSYE